jgi:hypothetical protein
MAPTTYLNPETNYSTTPIPQSIAERASDFEETHANSTILTVRHIEANKWSFVYALNRGTKRHAEYNYNFTL